MAREKVLKFLKKKGLSIDEKLVPDRQMTWPQARLFVKYAVLCAKPDEKTDYWSMLELHVILARAPRYPIALFAQERSHPYAEVMAELYNRRSELYNHHRN